MIKHYASLAEVFPTLGHRRLSIHKPILTQAVQEEDGFDNEEVAPNVASVLTRLFDLVLRVHNLLQVDFTKQLPAPWSPESEFTSIKRELDVIKIRHDAEISFTEDIFLQLLEGENGAGEYLMCSLTWHYCVVLMNRVFLPIRMNQGNEDSQSGTSDKVKKLNFPSGPKSFLQERAAACYGSANSIVRICTQVLCTNPLMLVSNLWSCQIPLALADTCSHHSWDIAAFKVVSP